MHCSGQQDKACQLWQPQCQCRQECLPQVVEVGQRLAYGYLIEEFTVEHDQLVVDFGHAAFGASNALLGFRQVRYPLHIVGDGGSDLQAGVIVSQLLLKCRALLAQTLDSLVGLLADLADGFGDYSGIAPDAFDLLDNKPLNFAGGN